MQLTKEQIQKKFQKEHPFFERKSKNYRKVLYPDLTQKEIGVLFEIKRRENGLHWGNTNHPEHMKKIKNYLIQ